MKTSVMFYNFHPLVHISPFIFGLIVGHLILNRPLKRHPYWFTVGIFSFIGFILGFFYMENIDIKEPTLSTLEIISMLTFGRIPMLTFFCWIIYSCICGCIGKISIGCCVLFIKINLYFQLLWIDFFLPLFGDHLLNFPMVFILPASS